MSKKNIFIAIIALIIFAILILAYVLLVAYIYPDMLIRSQFGDMFGGLNTFFSGLAFFGIILTILIQRKELSLQREELELTRDELKRTAKAQEKSEEALSKQAVSLKITAKLNGLSAMLQHYNTLIELTNSAKYGIDTVSYNTHKREADEIINEIKRLIDGK